MPTLKQKEKKQKGAEGASVFPSQRAKEALEIKAIKMKMNYSDLLDEIIERCGTHPRLLSDVMGEIK